MHRGITKLICLAVLCGMTSVLSAGAHAQTNASARRRANRQRRVQAIIQDTYNHRFEVTGGGGYTRFRPGPTLRHVDEIGWQVSGTRYFDERLGITADFHGYYGVVGVNPNPFALFNRGIREYVYQGGPTYRLYAQQKFAVSAHALAGASTGVFDVNTNHIPPPLIGLYPVGTVFASTLGFSADYNIDPALAFRLSPEVLITRFGGEFQFNKSISFGIVYRFGHLQ